MIINQTVGSTFRLTLNGNHFYIAKGVTHYAGLLLLGLELIRQ
jgi:hypothetical protein